MMTEDQDVRDAFARMVAAGPPPAGSAAAVRAGRKARRRRTLLATGGTAAAVAVLLLAASAVGGLGGGGTTTAATTSPSLSAPAPTAAPPPVVPGVSPAEARALATKCLAGIRDKGWTPAARARLQLYNTGPTPWGTRYIFYGPTEFLDCLHATEGDYRPDGGTGAQTRWIRGPIEIDRSIADGQPYDRGPGTFTVNGRVSAVVTKVEITVGASKLSVPVLNGTFMAAMTISAQEVLHGRPSYRALDADGRVVYASPPASTPRTVNTDCWVAPDGTVIRGDIPPRPGQKCLPATRWR